MMGYILLPYVAAESPRRETQRRKKVLIHNLGFKLYFENNVNGGMGK